MISANAKYLITSRIQRSQVANRNIEKNLHDLIVNRKTQQKIEGIRDQLNQQKDLS